MTTSPNLFQTNPRACSTGILLDAHAKYEANAHFMHQVHGTELVEILGATDGPVCHLGGYDALVTQCPGVRLMVQTADCMPIVLFDEATGTAAAIHAGWRSLVADIIPKVVEFMVEKGANPREIWAGIGPSLGPCCSEFSNPFEEIPEQYHWAIKQREDGRYFVHLNNIALTQLQNSGVYHRNIERVRVCTQCDPNLPSWRRDKSSQRMGTWIEIGA